MSQSYMGLYKLPPATRYTSLHARKLGSDACLHSSELRERDIEKPEYWPRCGFELGWRRSSCSELNQVLTKNTTLATDQSQKTHAQPYLRTTMYFKGFYSNQKTKYFRVFSPPSVAKISKFPRKHLDDCFWKLNAATY